MRAIKNLVGAILISIAIFLFWVIILPDYEERSRLRLTVESRSIDFEAKNKLIQKITELNNEYQSKYAELKRLSLVIPAKQGIEEMITILDGVAFQTGIQLKKMSLVVPDESGQSLPYRTVFIDLSLAGTYDSIFNFLNTVEKSIRLVDGNELNLSIDKTETDGRLIASFKGNAYFIKQNWTDNPQNIQPVN
ncbi:MAG: type 4a pilus biogenesis protein PilO [Candidatus Taylorbacteria bacterium]|nr:type 4a pilus biogenesis protein PilO [Candidatus Taylorbacteria bacterium]